MITEERDSLSTIKKDLITMFSVITDSWNEKTAKGICFICNKKFGKKKNSCKCGKTESCK